LFASVCSAAGRRSEPPEARPDGRSSYADHASYIAVCTIASARATIGGPSVPFDTASSAVWFQPSTVLTSAPELDVLSAAAARFRSRTGLRHPVGEHAEQRAAKADDARPISLSIGLIDRINSGFDVHPHGAWKTAT
jgi:hypothetical protein